jgi:hypothetical protein
VLRHTWGMGVLATTLYVALATCRYPGG